MKDVEATANSKTNPITLMKDLTIRQTTAILGGDVDPLSEPPSWNPSQEANAQMIQEIMDFLWIQQMLSQFEIAVAQ